MEKKISTTSAIIIVGVMFVALIASFVIEDPIFQAHASTIVSLGIVIFILEKNRVLEKKILGIEIALIITMMGSVAANYLIVKEIHLVIAFLLEMSSMVILTYYALFVKNKFTK